jgi:hypothetical protein
VTVKVSPRKAGKTVESRPLPSAAFFGLQVFEERGIESLQIHPQDSFESAFVIPLGAAAGNDATEEARDGESDLFRAGLDQIIDLTHALVQLGAGIDWEWPDRGIAALCTDMGWPSGCHQPLSDQAIAAQPHSRLVR